MNTSKKILLVGCGQWGQYILRDLLSLGCQVTVLAHSAATAERARTLGAQQVVNSLSQVAAPDGIVIATPTSTHATVIQDCLQFEVPLFVEKPMCTDLATARQLIQQAGDRIFIMHKWRYHPGVLKLRELAASGTLGELKSVHTIRHGWGNPHQDKDAAWHLLPHDLSIVFEILGYLPKPVAAQGHTVNGWPVNLIGLLGSEPSVCVDVSVQVPVWRREVSVAGTQGVALLDGSYATEIKIFRGDIDQIRTPVSETIPLSSDLPLFKELEMFVAFLSGGPTPKSSAEDALQILQVLIKLRQLAGFKN